MNAASETLADRFDAKAAVRLVRRHALLAAGCAALGLGAGYAYDRMQVPIYTATAKLEAKPAAARVLSSLQLEEGGRSTLRITSTTREQLRSRALAERVVTDLSLDQSSTFMPMGRVDGPSNSIADLIERADEKRVRNAASKVQGGLDIQFVRNTGMLKVRYSHSDKVVAANIANQVVESYVQMERERLSNAAGETRGFIEAQLAEAGAQLKASEAKLATFVSDAGLAIGPEGQSVQAESIIALRKAHAQATTERVAAERRLRQLERDGVATLPGAYANGSLQNARNMLARLRAEYRMKRARMKPDFPAMLSLADRIRDFEGDVERELTVVASRTRAEARQARDGEALLANEVEAAENELAGAREAGVGYSALNRQAVADRKRYATLAGKLAEITVSAGLATPPVAIAELASVPTSPSNGSFLIHLLGGLVLFGALGAGIATYREVSRDVFDFPSDVTDETGVPVLGTVPKVMFGRFARQDAVADSPVREAYRYLRNKLRAGLLEGDAQVLLVAGVGRHAGTSVTARRLALDLCALDRKVLLIDANFGDGVRANSFGLDGRSGLSDLLEWKPGTNVTGCFVRDSATGLTLMPAGALTAEASDRLASERMERVLRLLRKSFDAIVVDAAPILARADAAALSTYADATLLIVRHDRTSRSQLLAALQHLRDSQAQIIGALYTRYEGRAFQRAAKPQTRFDFLRELVVVPDRDGTANPVHDMMSAAASGMSKRRAA